MIGSRTNAAGQRLRLWTDHGQPFHNLVREGLPTNRELSPTFMDGPSDSNYSGFDAISVRAVIR